MEKNGCNQNICNFERMTELIRETIGKCLDETEAIAAINQKIDGAKFCGCHYLPSGSLTFDIKIEGYGQTRKISISRRFH